MVFISHMKSHECKNDEHMTLEKERGEFVKRFTRFCELYQYKLY